MAYTPENSAIRVTPEIEKHMQTLVSADEIKAYLAQVAVDQHLVERDRFSPDLLIPTEPGTAPRAFAKTVIVNGVKHIIEGSTEAELLANETQFYRTQLQPASTETQRDSATGRFVAKEDADKATQEELVRKSDLELKFKRGEISAADYLDQSGAIETFLATNGIDLEALKTTSEEKAGQRLATTWESATAEFLKTSDWPGGDGALAEIGRTIQSLGLEGSPSVESLQAAYADMKRRNAVPKNSETELHNRIASAKSPDELRQILGRGSSSLFGR
jgi:hypothetical protein